MTSPRDFDDFSQIPSQDPPPGPAYKTIYSVSELTARLKALIEESFPFVWIRGEISNFRMPASGHCYFTLKDEEAQIAAVMFRGQHRQLKFSPEDGLNIVGLGRLSVYEPRGSYQIILEYIEPAGIGALQIAFERLKRRLAEEGYFEERHKKLLPLIPVKISVITSPTGAVVHDIITIISRRFPNVHIEIVPTRVQGTGTESELVAALDLVNERADADVIILARGGGSLEDLQAFNSEAVAMAIFRSNIPVVSAVGHETDVTISDFIADLRAPTPSAAAELVVPEKNELRRRCWDLRQALIRNYFDKSQRIKSDLAALTRRMQDPRRKIQEFWMRIDDFNGRLMRLSTVYLRRERERLAWSVRQLNRSSACVQVHENKLKLDKIEYNLSKNIEIVFQKKQALFYTATAKLESSNPLAILRRGYSVVRTLPEHRVIVDPDQVNLQQDLEVLVSAGVLTCNVKGKYRHGEKDI